MRLVKTYSEFIAEKYINEKYSVDFQTKNSEKIAKIKEKLKGKPGSKSLMNMYQFYVLGGFEEIKDAKELITKCSSFDQLIRKNDDIWNSLGIIGMDPFKVDDSNLKIIMPYFSKFKAGTDEFDDILIIVQHADRNIKAQEKFLSIHGEQMKKESPRSYSMLVDRIAINKGGLQKGISQGMEVKLNGKIGWVPYQNDSIEFEKEEVESQDPVNPKEKIMLLKWKEGEENKINMAVKQKIGPENVEKAKNDGIPINLKSYVEHVMSSTYVGPYMIKR